ncbi:xanthine dehydrogenase family protein subunit M [Streptosporangiaceae bacterium NEAU-GS5]|nr:xanthine dehydrogenase family protein subunit M [Streptosporangiaceae bacterium NEAU-GS5]
MIPASFDYIRPVSIDEAAHVLGNAGDEAKVLAGGQSLLPLLRLRLAYPTTLVDVGRLEELRGIRDEGDHLFIGAMTTHDEVMRAGAIREHAPLLALAAATVADPAVRHRGTFGGSLAHGDPAGDLPAVARALDAQFVIRSMEGERSVGAADFFVDYLETALGPGDLLVGVRVPKLGQGWGFHYEKFRRTAQAWAIVAVAAAVRRDNGVIQEARVGLTNMGTTPVRATAVENAVRGAAVDNGGLREAANEADDGTEPPSDLHAKPDYRRHLARVLTFRALTLATPTPPPA